MVEQNRDIQIKYGDKTISVDLDDVEACLLVEAFNLPFTPNSLYWIDPSSGQKCFFSIHRRRKYVIGQVYHIPPKTSHTETEPSSPPKKTIDNVWDWKPLPELVQNAVVLSGAVYASNHQETDEYLMEKLKDHNFKKVLSCPYGRFRFVIAQEIDKDRVFIAFRGPHNIADWRENLHACQEEASKGMNDMKGMLHSGFLKQAMAFPVLKFLTESNLLSQNIIFCGHSLGGAVATLTAIMTMIKLRASTDPDKSRGPWVKCITFGAPMVGDGVFRQYCQSNDLERHIYNFNNDQDPLPQIFSNLQLLSANLGRLETDIRKSTLKPTDQTMKRKHQSWIDQKRECNQLLEKMAAFVEPVLHQTIMSFDNDAERPFMDKEVSRVLQQVKISTRNDGVYSYLGNYLVLCKNVWDSPAFAQHCEDNRKKDILEMFSKQSLTPHSHGIPVFHGIHDYKEMVARWNKCVGKSIDEETVQQIPRRIEFMDIFHPHIKTAELVQVEKHAPKKNYLQLRLTGYHLLEVIIEKCIFFFGCPFARNPDSYTCEKMVEADGMETLVIKEECMYDLFVSDLGSVIKVVTIFGECEYLLRKEHFRNVKLPSMKEVLSDHDSLAILIKRAIQRGMAVAHLTRIHRPGQDTWKPINERLIQEVMNLATNALNESDIKCLSDTFRDTSGKHQYILSNETEFEKIQAICTQIERHLRSPLKMTFQAHVGFGLPALLAGLAFAYFAGPGLVIVGLMETSSMFMSGLAGLFGFFGTGAAANYTFQRSAVDENYERVLAWMTETLMKKNRNSTNGITSNVLLEVSDLRNEKSLYNREKALLLMIDPQLGTDNFIGCDISECTKKSQKLAIKRIGCIRAIHEIRSLMAEQCYIGIVGMQDAGKTTLINSIWGVDGETGHFKHTTAPVIYEVDQKVSVVDFPGSTSLDYHAKTFSICGAMNNLIIVVVPFTGDMNIAIAREISSVFSVMSGSASTKVLLCINKSGYELPRALQEEMKQLEDPLATLKNHFAAKLNQYFSKDSKFQVSKDDILFTDWIVGDSPEMRKLGIVGVEGIKKEIRSYLMRCNIFADINTINSKVFKNMNLPTDSFILITVQFIYELAYQAYRAFTRLWS